jgi:hypothetical protein
MLNPDMQSKFLKDGWVQFALASHQLLERLREGLLLELRRDIPQAASLESYHLHVVDDDAHIAMQKRLFDWYRETGLGPEIIAQNLEVFRELVGLDLHVQASPYLRIARPHKPQDNVNVHRDTHYGGSPYELSVHVPFTDCGIDGSLGVITGSHLEADGAYPYVQTIDETVQRGSVKHSLGFTYAPKIMRPEDLSRLHPTGTKLGQAMLFSLALVHGQVVNSSSVTRFSCDIRVVNSMAPIDWARNAASGYYKPLSRSPVAQCADAYYAADAAFAKLP